MMSTDKDATQTTAFMEQYCKRFGQFPENLTIADAFACLGGNTYSFSNTFKHVDAYEVDPTRYRNLQKIVQKYPLKAKVSVKCQDCKAEGGILQINYGVVFLDPPWVNQEANPPIVDNKVFDDAFTLCTQIADAHTAEYIFLKLPIQAKDNPGHDFEASLRILKENMSALWGDIYDRTIHRGKKGERPVYTIVGARLKDPPAHAPAAEVSTSASSTDPKQQMAILLSQLNACQLLHENTQ